MEELYQSNDVTCGFPVINLVMVGISSGLLPTLHWAVGDFHPENPDFFVMEEPYQNNDVTCGMSDTDFFRRDGVMVPEPCLLGTVGRLGLLSQCIVTIGLLQDISMAEDPKGLGNRKFLLLSLCLEPSHAGGQKFSNSLIFDGRLHHDLATE